MNVQYRICLCFDYHRYAFYITITRKRDVVHIGHWGPHGMPLKKIIKQTFLAWKLNLKHVTSFKLNISHTMQYMHVYTVWLICPFLLVLLLLLLLPPPIALARFYVFIYFCDFCPYSLPLNLENSLRVLGHRFQLKIMHCENNNNNNN